MLLLAVALTPLMLMAAIVLFAPLRETWPERPSRSRVAALFVMGAFCPPLWLWNVIGPLLLPLPEEGVWRGIEAGFTEEAAKLAILLLLAYRLRGFAEPYTGMFCGAAVGLGFAFGENILYGVFTSDPNPIMRVVMAIPGHASFGIIMGYWLSRAAASGTLSRFLALAYALPASFHVLHNVCVHFQDEGGIVPLVGIATDLGALTLALTLIHYNRPAGLGDPAGRRAPAAMSTIEAVTPPRFCGACGAMSPVPAVACRRCGAIPGTPSGR